MAEASISVDQDQFSCPVCLDLLKDPVTVPCGHSFCMVCINSCWDQEDQRGLYSCPQCRETFTPRPVLRRNYFIAEMSEKLKKTEVRAAPPAGSGDVECDFCTGRKRKAAKSCLTCLASFCEDHIKNHSEIPALKKHKLVKVSTRLQEKICSQHDEMMKIYCRTDRSCICYLCTLEKHKGHDTVSAAAERPQKQRELEEMQREVQQMIQEKQKKLQELEQAVNTLKKSNKTGVEELEKLGEEIADLKRRNTELEQLSLTEDHIHFLQSFQSLSVSSGSEDSSSISDPSQFAADPLLLSEPKTREDFLQYFCQLTLDPNTVNRSLILSEKNRVVEWIGEIQRYRSHIERFEWPQVLSVESLSGRCYWEVEWSEEVDISVSYKRISRDGVDVENRFGNNAESWSLCCSSSSSLTFWHNNIQTELPGRPSSTIGVYVDHSAGTLSFYSVSDTMTLLHTVHSTFTDPLYAGFFVHSRSSVRFCDKQ
ncbi:E3 ubiquitin/ISG15 ligase TRIM25-like isoform X4 [Colossoma macropomum]|uniref:E3 ubiquitin/ISG15 ligase TRIM25-like isoform X4 n=1 Tax=Colossoma macropomum TaxID=42526 RepID=UPI0018645E19|nr:E3 ubiquitin/ISG15 ligase TRIM25-like isoform X4 [Colossoma macropomum]